MSSPQAQSTHAPAPTAAPHSNSAPRVGTKIQDFTLKLATKEGVAEFNLAKNLGQGPVVLAFFPIAFSGVCTKEVCDLRDNLAQFQGLGAKVFGFSTDSHHANIAFAKAHDLPLGIISDPNREVVPRIWQTATVAGIHNVAKRGVLLLSPDGTVKWTNTSDDPTVWIGTEEIRKHL